jgi:hypothetical protein
MVEFVSFLPVHKSTCAGLKESSTEDADIVLGAVIGVGVVSKFFRTVEFR